MSDLARSIPRYPQPGVEWHPAALTHAMVLEEARRLIWSHNVAGLDEADLRVDRDGVLVCTALPANGRISGGIRLEGQLMRQSLDDFSSRVLMSWLQRMARLKALQTDLKALGVME